MPVHKCSCGAKYKFAEDARGKKARCKKCESVFRLGEVEDDGGIPIAANDPFLGELEAAAARSTTAPTTSSPIAREDRFPSGDAAVAAGFAATTPTGYWRSVLYAFLFPTSVGALVTYIIMLALLCAYELFFRNWAFFFSGIAALLIYGWYYAFCFNIISSAANGEEDLPEISMTGGFIDDVFIPFFSYLGTWLVVLIPCIIAWTAVGLAFDGSIAAQLFYGGMAAVMQIPGAEIPQALFFIGLFMWPIIALCIALGGFASLARVDLMFVTVIRTIPAYLLTTAVVFGSMLLSIFLRGKIADAGDVTDKTVMQIVAIAVDLYLWIVAMKFIGLYYHHFKRRFAWDWG